MKAQKPNDLLPWYINGTLQDDEQRAVEALLHESEPARLEASRLKSLARQVRIQPAARPGAALWADIRTRIADPALQPVRALSARASWLVGAAMTAVLLVVLWLAVRPGVMLEWQVSGAAPSAFKIYRAEVGSDSYALIREVPADAEITDYRYIDASLLPLHSYVYRVEGVGETGRLALSTPITTSPFTALPGQAAVVLASLLLAYTSISLINYLPRPYIHKHSGAAV